MRLCKYCYQMALSAFTLFTGNVQLGLALNPDGMNSFTFTLNHDECECCIGQKQIMAEELKKALEKHPVLPEEVQAFYRRCCCEK